MSTLMLTKAQVRRFLLTYQGLYGDYRFSGKEGILSYINSVGCIQFDPLNVVGINPQLVLQSRIKSFKIELLYQLLYKERVLIDYWDKNMSILPAQDWPYFSRYRNQHRFWCENHHEVVENVRNEFIKRGPLCSADLDYNEKIDWPWGPARMSRAVLEGMFNAGMLSIHNKSGTRKYYDLAERCIPEYILSAQEPNLTEEEYYEWHTLRRIRSIGMLWNRPSDAWLGMMGFKSSQRNNAFERLISENKITEVKVEGIKNALYYPTECHYILEKVLNTEARNNRSSIIAPLDNLLWDRNLINELFSFEYRWEVYKPEPERKYGYYVLPVLYGDRFVARFEPKKHRDGSPLIIKKWWWERDIKVTTAMKLSIIKCFERFAGYLGTKLDKDFGDMLE